jgi:hypothetical protein
MLRADLEVAGVAVEADGPDGAETRDFHDLRTVYTSDVIRAGADLTRLHDLGAVVNNPPRPAARDRATLRMTGTDGGPFGSSPEQQPAGAIEDW